MGEDIDTVIEKNESRTINRYFDTNIVGKYSLTTLADLSLSAKNNLSFTTVSGIVSMKSGGTLNIKSAGNFTVVSEAAISETASSTIDSIAGTIYTIKSGGGSPTATNKVDINPA